MVMVNMVYWLPIGGPAAVSVFIAWTEWTLAMALLRWQHYKYRRGYYYIIINANLQTEFSLHK